MMRDLCLRLGGAVSIIGLVTLGGCTTTSSMDVYVPEHCHGAAEPFSTFTVQHISVPGFIEEVIDTALISSLSDRGMTNVDDDSADVSVNSTFYLIDRNPPAAPEDPFGEELETGGLNRFVTHLKVDLIDQRTGNLIWTGAMYRAHAIQGGETFHNERAVLIIRNAFDEMFVGLDAPCE